MHLLCCEYLACIRDSPLALSFFFLLFQEVEDRIKQMFPVMYEDLAEPFQINMDLVFF